MDLTQEKLDNLTKPLGSLGRLEELAKQICGIIQKADEVLFMAAGLPVSAK